MRRMIEAALFLAIAALIHAAAFWAWPANAPRAGGAAGEEGAALIGVGPEMAALVEAWEREPDAPAARARPRGGSAGDAALERPDAPAAGPGPSPGSSPPIRDQAPPRLVEPEPPARAEAAMRPPPARPARKPAPPRVKAEARSARPAPPKGAPASRSEKGDAAEGPAADMADAARSSGRDGAAALIQTWGGAIRRAIEARRGAAGPIRRTRTARVALTVARSGALLSSSLQGSSGSAALDRAALQAVAAAAPYPPAPGGLAAESYDFALPIVFRR